MILKESKINSPDNSSANTLKVVHYYNKGKNNLFARQLGILLVSVKTLRKSIPKKKVKKGQLVRAILLNTKYKTTRKIGISFRFKNNYCTILNKDMSGTFANRIHCAVPVELKEKKYTRMLIISKSNI